MVCRAAARLGRGQPHEPLPESGVHELRTVTAAFNRMATNLESMERDRAMVLAGISHDLRTPLSRLRLALEMSGAESGASEAMIEDIGEIDTIIGQFLDFARGENEDKSRQELDPMLHELGEHYQRLQKKVSVGADTGLSFPFARMALRRAISNLVDNALRYAGEPIELEAKKDIGGVAIEVRDRGPGIPAGEVERLKRPFTRLDDARSGASGAGLGLAIVRTTAERHRGRAYAQGSRFTIELPALEL